MSFPKLTAYQVTTIVVFAGTLGATIVLALFHQPVPAIVASLLGASGLALLPSWSNRVNVDAAKASMRPPSMPDDEERRR